MLIRLRIAGFKNLNNVDIRFGPFTCIAGPNAVGKSNLFDAIRFLSNLSSMPLLDAALSIRSKGAGTSEIRDLFHRIGDIHSNVISFVADMILPKSGKDDLGQLANATITFVRYSIEIEYISSDIASPSGPLKINKENLEHIRLTDAPKELRFDHSVDKWRKSVLKGRRTTSFISTEFEDQVEKKKPIIRLSQDGKSGRPRSFLAENLPRTVLSTVNATESPTALIARREMQSWRLLQLEPSAMREPDTYTTHPGLGRDGSHLPATLYHLARQESKQAEITADNKIFYHISLRLMELVDDVRTINIDKDVKRELLTLILKNREGTTHPARSLSDGTLRFLALSIIESDPNSPRLICLEEPENGIHPARIPAMIRLLQDIACDVSLPVGDDNPLRQVIVNTHSPLVAGQVPDDSLILAETIEGVSGTTRYSYAKFSWLSDTWRSNTSPDIRPVSKGKVISYLDPSYRFKGSKTKFKRVIDRADLQLRFFD